MRQFLTNEQLSALLVPDIVNTLGLIRELKGRTQAQLELEPTSLDSLQTLARIQSTEASNRIEGIYTSDARLKALVGDKTTPRNRDEQEILGYRDVLALIHEQHNHIPLTPNVILQLHRDLFKHTGLTFGGAWKDSDNEIVEIRADGSRHTRFRPTSALETPHAVEALCDAYRRESAAGLFDPALLAAMFTFDFVSIHPFNDGNGRMSRLLTLLLLYKSGIEVGKYVSIEKAIEQSKGAYYEALKASSAGWNEGSNDYAPFVRYLLGVIVSAYRELEERSTLVISAGVSKSEQVRRYVESTLGTFSKHDVVEAVPNVSSVTVERTLKQMLDEGTLVKIGSGRGTRYALSGR